MWIIHPFPRMQSAKRSWNQFHLLADEILKNGLTDKIYFTGVEEQCSEVSRIISRMLFKEQASNRCGIYDLCDLASVLKRADLVITVNTMTMHLAAALGISTVAIIGGTPASVVAPCDLENFRYVENVDNINDITVDQVMEKIEELI